ncbi:hypothetical protein C8D92_10457 [Tamilnaduibacter salinus]|uniref:Nucleotide modification associated domain-containing protein n=1 Tax=Tamilnaduibacter salinus TaxID=1484056 RepID=A0A2U1CXI3_9GAMM|nr:hypothetical protein [Tamilnaduibacter salinus]PVY76826.1 hypothetical protein C8D92_10457 [Tamilnaduibacter salinus]
MRLILSRKGFDSSAGGCPSPVFPDGTRFALPIPDARSRIRYRHIRVKGRSPGPWVRDLTGGRISPSDRAHLDPDLAMESYPRQAGWRPVLGQTGSAQGHLTNQGVQAGDLFLFFGLFRPVERHQRRWRFVPGTRPYHALWGWLQAGAVHRVDDLGDDRLPWARYHPHFELGPDSRNTLYVARDELSLPGVDACLPGAGVWPLDAARFRLTAPDARLPTQWRLPADFLPGADRPPLSYHSQPDRWTTGEADCRLRCAARGQEFVLDLDDYPGVLDWVRSLLTQPS